MSYVFNPFTGTLDNTGTITGETVAVYSTFSSFPGSATNGALALAQDTQYLYCYSTGSSSWVLIAGPDVALSIGTIDSQSASADGAVIASDALFMQSASASNPGLVNTTTQTFAGSKTFSSAPSFSSIINTGTLTLPTSTDTLVGQATTDTLTNKTIAAGSNTISGLTNSNLSGSAGITNANLANSAVTIGSTSVSLGNTAATVAGLTLTSPTIGNIVNVSNVLNIKDSTDNTKIIAINASGNTTGKTLTLSSSQSNSETLTIPNITTSDTLSTLGLTQTFSGVNTFSGQMVNSVAAAASTPALLFTGSPYTSGNGTTNEPQLLLQDAGSGSSAWNTHGTYIGVNAKSGFSGNLIDLQLNGSSNFKVASSGTVTCGNQINAVNFIGSAAGSALESAGNNDAITVGNGNSFTAGNTTQVKLATQTDSATSGTDIAVAILPTYAQTSGSAANTDLLINRSESGGVGSGNQYFIDMQVGGSTKAHIDHAGNAVFNGLTIGSTPINQAATDIAETSFSLANNQSSAANVTGLSFSTSSVVAFQAIVYVGISATSSLYEMFTLTCVYNGSTWYLSQTSVGNSSGITFTITSAGQVQYTSGNYSGFSSGTMKFRAWTL